MKKKLMTVILLMTITNAYVNAQSTPPIPDPCTMGQADKIGVVCGCSARLSTGGEFFICFNCDQTFENEAEQKLYDICRTKKVNGVDYGGSRQCPKCVIIRTVHDIKDLTIAVPVRVFTILGDKVQFPVFEIRNTQTGEHVIAKDVYSEDVMIDDQSATRVRWTQEIYRGR